MSRNDRRRAMNNKTITSTPWIESGDAPPLPLDRDKRDILSQGIADPLVDYDIIPLTYTNSRWSAFFYRADQRDLKHVLPKCLELEDDIVEFWYVQHDHTQLGPYNEMGVTVSVSHRDADGKVWRAGYYPYMYLTQDAAVFAGREPYGFPKKTAYLVAQEHGGGQDDGYTGFGNDYFNFVMERRGYLIHTANGRYDDAELSAQPKFYADPTWGRMNLRLLTSPSLQTTRWDLTYLANEISASHAALMGQPDLEGQPCFQPRLDTVRTASPKAIRAWAMQATPFDNLGAMLPVKELIGLLSFSMELTFSGAQTIWSQLVERNEEDIQNMLFATPFQYTMRHRFPKPPGV
jgi:hypothetical protein